MRGWRKFQLHQEDLRHLFDADSYSRQGCGDKLLGLDVRRRIVSTGIALCLVGSVQSAWAEPVIEDLAPPATINLSFRLHIDFAGESKGASPAEGAEKKTPRARTVEGKMVLTVGTHSWAASSTLADGSQTVFVSDGKRIVRVDPQANSMEFFQQNDVSDFELLPLIGFNLPGLTVYSSAKEKGLVQVLAPFVGRRGPTMPMYLLLPKEAFTYGKWTASFSGASAVWPARINMADGTSKVVGKLTLKGYGRVEYGSETIPKETKFDLKAPVGGRTLSFSVDSIKLEPKDLDVSADEYVSDQMHVQTEKGEVFRYKAGSGSLNDQLDKGRVNTSETVRTRMEVSNQYSWASTVLIVVSVAAGALFIFLRRRKRP